MGNFDLLELHAIKDQPNQTSTVSLKGKATCQVMLELDSYLSFISKIWFHAIFISGIYTQ